MTLFRRATGAVAGPVAVALLAGAARALNGHRLRPLSKRERQDLATHFGDVDLLRVRIAEGCHLPLLRDFMAITLGSTIYVRGHLTRRPRSLLAHELAHVRQFQRQGWLRMSAAYATLWLQHGYTQHPMEVEARGVEKEFLAKEKRGG